MRKMFISLLVLTLFIPPSLSWGAEWIRYGVGAEGNTWFYDNSSIEKYGNIAKVSIKHLLSEEGKSYYAKGFKVEPKSLSHHIAQVEVDCKTKTMRMLSSVLYFQDGSKVYEHSVPGKWDSPAPGSVEEKLYNKVCGFTK